MTKLAPMPSGDRKRRSGASVPEAQRHTRAVKLRLDDAESAALDTLTAAGEPASRVVGALVVAEVERRDRAARRQR